MLKRKAILLIIIFTLLPSKLCLADSQKRMVVVTLNTAALNDFLNCPQILRLAEDGCSALMSVRSCGKDNFYKTCLTLGSGEKGEAPFNSLEAYTADSVIASEYKYLTMNDCNTGNIVNLSINRLKEINSKTLYDAQPGKLGQLLRNNGIRTAFIGGFWNENSIKSPAFFMSMDNSGLADTGDIEGVFSGITIDMDKCISSFKRCYDDSQFIVVELGDIESLYVKRSLFSEEAYEYSKRKTIDNAAKIIDSIVNSMDFKNDELVILSSFSSNITDDGGEMLSPFILYDGGSSRGILKSMTTRRSGIISAQDFAPFVLNFFRLKSESFQGNQLINVSNINIDYLKKVDERTYSISHFRAPVLKGYAVCILIVLIIFLLHILKPSAAMFPVKLMLTVPVSFLLSGLFDITNIVYMVLFIILSSVIIVAAISTIFKNNFYFIGCISFLNIFLLSADILTGGHLLMYSIFSYDPIIGARFYGLGNEFQGCLAGCGLISAGCILERKPSYKIPASALLIFLSLEVGLPFLGANAGGFMTVSAGFLIFIALEYGIGLKTSLKAGGAALILSLLFLVGVNMIFKGSQSHLGRMFTMISTQGLSYGLNMIFRKVNMEIRLIKYTIWSIVLIALIIASAVYSYKPRSRTRQLFGRYPHFRNVFISGVASCIAALLLNDSGIVTSAVIMLYIVFSGILLYYEYAGSGPRAVP